MGIPDPRGGRLAVDDLENLAAQVMCFADLVRIYARVGVQGELPLLAKSRHVLEDKGPECGRGPTAPHRRSANDAHRETHHLHGGPVSEG